MNAGGTVLTLQVAVAPLATARDQFKTTEPAQAQFTLVAMRQVFPRTRAVLTSPVLLVR